MIALSVMGHAGFARVLFVCSIFLLPAGLVALSPCERQVQSLNGDPTMQQPLQGQTEHTIEIDALHQLADFAEGGTNVQEPALHPSYTDPTMYIILLDALEVMESHFFDISLGTWPQAIDWTAAVIGTHVSATLASMTAYLKSLQLASPPPSIYESRDRENLINRYFTQVTSFYFGENAFSLRTQAYDDMLWVVLGWLEAIKFIELHSSLYYAPHSDDDNNNDSNSSQWYARQFIPQYAHRARIFYNLASKGWDTHLCGGGMVWNPYLAPYKNAITNQLYIAASIGMYLHFPGDYNSSPFAAIQGLPPAKAHDVRYLNNAVQAYEWLKSSGMRNDQGLYVDGFHIKGWHGGNNGSNGTGKCDLRDETTYTYNQGVILSGLRGLWIATSVRQYLIDGHELVQNVIAATGWEDRDTERRLQWAGLGRGGVMEEQCDWSGTCSQNGQTFKGIFFHHLTLFCSPLPSGHDDSALHQRSCDEYKDWIRHNAFAACITRNDKGEFGEWWGRPSRRTDEDDDDDDAVGTFSRRNDEDENATTGIPHPSIIGTDYRNHGVPKDENWHLPADDAMYRPGYYYENNPTRKTHQQEKQWQTPSTIQRPKKQDINDRGRGRTVETQSGGVAVLRALWKLVEARHQYDHDG